MKIYIVAEMEVNHRVEEEDSTLEDPRWEEESFFLTHASNKMLLKSLTKRTLIYR